MYRNLLVTGVRDVQSDHAASHLGKAEGIVTLLRATPYHAHNKKVFLPMELLALVITFSPVYAINYSVD